MNCPSCGTPVQDGLDVCPACHASLRGAPSPDGDWHHWCSSCGSPVPEGAEACPVCGMPVAGSFEDDWATREPQTPDEDDDARSSLVSAIPPVPERGEDSVAPEASSTRVRLLLVAVVAASVLIGGTALFITRPWDPDAYVTHAKEDADTSMEGYPGRVSHLSSQDLIEDTERTQYLAAAEPALDAYLEHLRQIADKAIEQHEALDAFLDTGVLEDAQQHVEQTAALAEELGQATEEVAGLKLDASGLEGKQQSELLLGSYLEGWVGLLHDAWEGASKGMDDRSAYFAARGVLSEGREGKTLEEWRGLFENEYARVTRER